MKYGVAFVCCCLLIALFKIPDTAGLYLTDGNNYLLYAKLLGQGKLLYKDIYLDNFPLMMYISVVYRWLTLGSMQFFNYTATLEKICIAGLIYYLVFRKWENHSTGFLAGITFLGSYSVMASSFQLGFFTDVLLLMLAYMCVERKNLILAGILSACAVLVKAYSVFIVFGLFIYIIQRYRAEVWKYIVTGIITGICVMLPTIVTALPQCIEQTLSFGLVRAPSVDKTGVYYSFIVYDFLIFFLCIWNLTLWRKNFFIALGTLLVSLFLILYKDVYFAYFAYMPLLAALGAGYLLETQFPFTKQPLPKVIFATFLVFAVIVSFSTYLSTSRFVKKVANEKKLFEVVKDQHADALYGHSILINGISYFTDIPAYLSMYEITTAFFTNGKMNRTRITRELLKSRTLLILYSYTQGQNRLYDAGIIDSTLLAKANCRVIYTQFLEQVTESINKEVAVVRCYDK